MILTKAMAHLEYRRHLRSSFTIINMFIEESTNGESKFTWANVIKLFTAVSYDFS
jgi:hypothetical protein